MPKPPFTKEDQQELEGYFKQWWKNYQKRSPIVERQGTWWHLLARWIHRLAKLSFLIPNFSKKIKPSKVTLDPLLKQKLEQKFDFYMQEIKKHQDHNGFIMHEECDSLLFSSLMSCIMKVDVKSARDSEGWWHRRPLDLPECWGGGSGSTISRDMMTGLIWHLYLNKDLESAASTYDLYKKHDFIMGQGDPARLILMPGLEATFAEIIYKLGGKNHWFARHQVQTWPKSLTGYEVHLLMLHSLLVGKIAGHIDSKILAAYEAYANKNSCNPLHQFAHRLYTDGNMDEVVDLLLNEAWWPADRLPKRKDRKNDWITSRDCDSDNWLPASDDLEVEHTGGDFIFVAWLVLQSLEGK